jgi:hypothetical protein
MVLNVRNVPDALMRQLKADAAERGMTLRSWVLARLSGPGGGAVATTEIETTATGHVMYGDVLADATNAKPTAPKPKEKSKTMFPNLPTLR